MKRNRTDLAAQYEDSSHSPSGNGPVPISFETIPMDVLNTDSEIMDTLSDETVQDLMADILAGKQTPVPDVVKLGGEYFAYTELETIAAAAELDADEMVCRVFPWGNEAIPPAVVDELRLLIH